MHYKIAAGLIVLLSVCIQTNVCSQKRNSKMNNQPFAVNVKCRANEQCLFEGKEMFLDIAIINNQNTTLNFPLEFVQKNGPIITLIDTRTKAETVLKRNIANPALLDKLVSIKPGESANVEWVITAEELRRFGDEVDLSAEVTIMAEIPVNGKKVEISATDTRRIVSKK
jgi:hypothetical protein